MNIFEKAREAEEAKGKARDAYKKAADALKATPEYKAKEEAWTCETLVEAIKAMEEAEEAYMKSGYRYLV